MTGYPLNRLFEEVAFLAYYFHWPYDQIMDMEHHERLDWVAEITKIHKVVNESSAEGIHSTW